MAQVVIIFEEHAHCDPQQSCFEDAPPSLPKLSAIMFTAYGTTILPELPRVYEDFAKSRASRRIICGVEVAELRRADVTLH